MFVDEITRFKQASEFTGFHKKLGILVAPYLNERWTMADIGCGLGLIDFEIAECVKSIQAIDLDKVVLADLEGHIEDEFAAGRDAAGRIEVRQKNAFEISDEKWDVVLTSFFGATICDYEKIMSLAKHRMIIITRAQERNGIFDPMPNPQVKTGSADKIENWLKARGLGHRKSIVDLQFGQPFKTIADIHDFLDSKHLRHPDLVRPQLKLPEGKEDEDAHWIEGEFDAETLICSAEDRIIKTNRLNFPYYLPRNLRVAIFIIVCK